MELYIDIETIPAQRPDILEEIRQSKQAELEAAIAAVKPPINYGAEAADKWMKEKGAAQIEALTAGMEAEIDAAYRKTGLDGAFGQICVIGWAFNNEKAQTICSAEDEGSILYGFSKTLGEVDQSERFNTMVIGHNVSSFDLRFMVQRHWINGLRPHHIITRAAQAKPWESDKVFDTMVQWAGVGNRVSLAKLCKALNIPSPKTDLDGSKVWDAVKEGRLDDVAMYCAGDVEATRAVYKRMTFQQAA